VNQSPRSNARDLILQKHHNFMQEQLERYLNREKRELVSLVEKLVGQIRSEQK
jgi:hypothetical protein